METIKILSFFKKQVKKITPWWVKFLILFIPRRLKLRAMGSVLKKLEKKGIELNKLDALEVFAKNGEWHTMDYAPFVRRVEAWEINELCRVPLKRNIPDVFVKITDSIKEIKRTKKKFNFIVLDNPAGIYGEKGEYCEHFNIFPNIFRTIEKEAVIIVNVFPRLDKSVFTKFPYLKDIVTEDHLRRKGLFYKTDNPNNVSFNKIVDVYKNIIESKGFELEWHFLKKRNVVYYLVLKVKKSKIKGVNDNN